MEEIEVRREKLAKKLEPNSIALFSQDSDFYYLTGSLDPEEVFILVKGDEELDLEYFIYPITEAETAIPKLFINKKIIYYPFNKFDNKIMMWLQTAKTTVLKEIRSLGQEVRYIPDALCNILPIMHELRVIKSEQEISKIRKAANISAQAHKRIMQMCSPGILEYQLEAEFIYYCMKNGGREMSFPVIIASGNDACTLHYTENNKEIKSGDLVLIDAGCKYEHYAADISRTFPANGKFTEEQRAIYELVLQAQMAGINKIYPGSSAQRVQEVMIDELTKGLINLGILTGNLKYLIKSKAYEKFYMHKGGHWLGLDVHDTKRYIVDEENYIFAPGMVLTIEPGIYISEDTSDVDAKWKCIGVRIEDDLLVTNNGHEILTAEVPKTIEEIEQLKSQ